MRFENQSGVKAISRTMIRPPGITTRAISRSARSSVRDVPDAEGDRRNVEGIARKGQRERIAPE